MPKWSPSLPALVTVGTLTIALGTWLSMAHGGLCWQGALGSLLLWALLCWFGVCSSALLLEQGRPIDPLLSTVLGFYCISAILFLGTVVLRLDLLISLSFCVALLGLLAYVTRKRQPLRRLERAPASAIALLIAVVLATLWSRQNLSGLSVTTTTVTSLPWYDTFHHSVYINHFAQGTSSTLGTDPLLSNSPIPPYHYAAYLIPSLLVRCTGIPAYLATVSVFAPVGTLLTGLAAYGFGRSVRGPLAGLFAVVLCLALPDPTFYLLENRWLSYFFFQQIAGNGAMGTALMLLAWTYCIQASREQLRRNTVVGLLAALLVVCFKSQIFLAYSFGLLLFVALTLPRLALRFRLTSGVLATAALAICVMKVLPSIPRAPTLMLGKTAGPANLHWSLSKLGGACQQCIVELSKDYALFLPVGLFAFLVLVFGVLLPLSLLLASSPQIRMSLGSGGMWFLWTALLNYLVVTLGLELNAGHGDPYEIIHKTFIWPYLAISVWCGCAIAAWLLTLKAIARQSLLAVGLPLLLWALGNQVFDGAGRLQTAFVYPGSDPATRIVMQRGAFDTALYLRDKTPKNAVVQPGAHESHLMFQGLMERRSYVGYPVNAPDNPAPSVRANQQLSAMLAAATENDFRQLARACHIDYFVLYPGQQPAWANTLRPAFQSGEYRVYRL